MRKHMSQHEQMSKKLTREAKEQIYCINFLFIFGCMPPVNEFC